MFCRRGTSPRLGHESDARSRCRGEAEDITTYNMTGKGQGKAGAGPGPGPVKVMLKERRIHRLG